MNNIIVYGSQWDLKNIKKFYKNVLNRVVDESLQIKDFHPYGLYFDCIVNKNQITKLSMAEFDFSNLSFEIVSNFSKKFSRKEFWIRN